MGFIHVVRAFSFLEILRTYETDDPMCYVVAGVSVIKILLLQINSYKREKDKQKCLKMIFVFESVCFFAYKLH